jgi:hypothetical protein
VNFKARFSGRDCTPCPYRPLCTRSKLEPRIVGLQSREYHEALQAMRRQQTTEEFRIAYAHARASKAPMPRLSGVAACDMPATEALRKHILNTSSPQPPSTRFGLHPGHMERPSHGLAAHISPLCKSKQLEFATSGLPLLGIRLA